jgi:SulP family sulfate permease
VAALAIWVMVALAGELAGRMVLPALAALLLLTAWNMAEPHRWPARLKLPRAELALMALTAGLTVLVDLTVAIVVGTVLGLALRRFGGSTHTAA